jgi:xylulose-5-phosphate/fructose-6-phosphate phosphoketolase
VRGYNEEGTTTTPFDMVVLNRISRFHLCLDALHYCEARVPGAEELKQHCHAMLKQHHEYIREHFDDVPEIRDWVWRD